MAEDKAPVRRRQMGAHGLMFRRRRIFAQLREGYTYDEIAAEEGVSPSRQLDRLAPATRLGAEGIAAGDIAAITPYLKALDRLGRYQAVASANQVYDDEARKKLMDKVNRLAENLGINEEFAAAVKAHLQKSSQIPTDEPGEAEGREGDAVGSSDFMQEANAPEATHWGGWGGG